MELYNLNSNFESIPKQISKELQGKWVALLNGKIIASNESFKELFNLVKNKGLDKKVLFHRFSENELFIA